MANRMLIAVLLVWCLPALLPAEASKRFPSYLPEQLKDKAFVAAEITRLETLRAEMTKALASASSVGKLAAETDLKRAESALEALRYVAEHGFSDKDPKLQELAYFKKTKRVRVRTDVFRPPFYRIEGTKPSYLLGTIHSGDDLIMNVFWLARSSILDADAVFTEISFDEYARFEDWPQVYLPAGKNLREVLPIDLYEWLCSVVGAGSERIQTVSRLKVWAVILVLDEMAAAAARDRKNDLPETDKSEVRRRLTLDGTVHLQAKRFGKQVGGLETIKEHADVFDVMSQEEQIGWLRQQLNLLDDSPLYSLEHATNIVQAYLIGNDKLLWELIQEDYDPTDPFEQRLMKRILSDRNNRMKDRIVSKVRGARGQSFFFAVGVAHLLGPDGLVTQLRQAGFTLTRISGTPDDQLPGRLSDEVNQPKLAPQPIIFP